MILGRSRFLVIDLIRVGRGFSHHALDRVGDLPRSWIPTSYLDIKKDSDIFVSHGMALFSSNPHRYPFASLDHPTEADLRWYLQHQHMSASDLNHVIEEQCRDLNIQPMVLWKQLSMLSNSEHFRWDLQSLSRLTTRLGCSLQGLTLSEFILCLNYFVFALKPNPCPNLLERVTNLLDDECVQRLRRDRQLNRSTLCKMSYYLLLIAADRSEKMHFQLRSKFNKELPYLLLGKDHVSKLHDSEFVYLNFVSGMSRDFRRQLRKIKMVDESLDVPVDMVKEVNRRYPTLLPEEIGIIAHSFHMSHLKLDVSGSPGGQLRMNLLETLTRTQMNDGTLHQPTIGSICKLLQKRGRPPRLVGAKLVNHFANKLHLLNYLNLNRLVGFIASDVMVYSDDLIRSYVKLMKPHLASLRCKDLEKVCFILLESNFKEDTEFLQKIQDHLVQVDRSHPNSPIHLAFSSLFLFKMDIFMDDEISKIFTAINKSETLWTAVKEEDYGVGAVKALLSTVHGSIPTKVFQSIVHRSGNIYKNLLFHLTDLDMSLDLFHPKYQGVRLDPKLRCKLTSLVTPSPASSGSLHFKKTVFHFLRSKCGLECGFVQVWPTFASKDIVLCLDTESKTSLPLEEDLIQAMSKPNFRLPERQGIHWVVLTIPGSNERYMDHQRLTGTALFKQKQLKAIGYHIATLTEVDWRRMSKQDETVLKDHIHSIILSASR